MAGENAIKDSWSADYRKWLLRHRNIKSAWTLAGYVACARTYLVYLEDTEGLDFASWLTKHKRAPKTVQLTVDAARYFQLYLDENHQKAIAAN